MLSDLLIQLFDDQPRRPTSLYLLLNGKKTLSILYAAMQHDQLQWLQLYPTLSRDDYQAAIAKLHAQHALKSTPVGDLLADPAAQRAAALRVPLPHHYQPALGVHDFWLLFQLAVQVLSEASYHERRYRPVSQDWAQQRRIRQWWGQQDAAAAVSALHACFEKLPATVGDDLAQQLVGHDFVGGAEPATLAEALARIDAVAALIEQIAAQGSASPWYQLWGGPRPLGTPSQYDAVRLAQQGLDRPAIAARLRLRPSTVNEHLLIAAIQGADLPLAQLYPQALRQAFSQLAQPQADYHDLLDAVAGSDFFQVRLFQILAFQGRWPRGDA